MRVVSNSAVRFLNERGVDASCVPSSHGRGVLLEDAMRYWLSHHAPKAANAFRMVTQLRPYQSEAAAAASNGGTVVLPCGGGTTLTGIEVARRAKKMTLICVIHAVSALQWKQHILGSTTVRECDVCVMNADASWLSWIDVLPIFVIATYSMLTGGGHHYEKTDSMLRVVRAVPFGLVLFDEVHLAVAPTFRKLIGTGSTQVGLTATLVREDGSLATVGGKLTEVVYQRDVDFLHRHGYVARVTCCTVVVRTTDRMLDEMQAKVAAFLDVAAKHDLDRLVLFSDDVWVTALVADLSRRLLDREVIGPMSMATPLAARARMIDEFEQSARGLLIMAKVGDSAMDLHAPVGVQLNCRTGSRMQEGQRVGRIQRRNTTNSSAWYSIVSNRPSELSFRSNRDAYLESLGYCTLRVFGDQAGHVPDFAAAYQRARRRRVTQNRKSPRKGHRAFRGLRAAMRKQRQATRANAQNYGRE